MKKLISLVSCNFVMNTCASFESLLFFVCFRNTFFSFAQNLPKALYLTLFCFHPLRTSFDRVDKYQHSFDSFCLHSSKFSGPFRKVCSIVHDLVGFWVNIWSGGVVQHYSSNVLIK